MKREQGYQERLMDTYKAHDMYRCGVYYWGR